MFETENDPRAEYANWKAEPEKPAGKFRGALNTARETAVTKGRELAGKAKETGVELKERALEALNSERGQNAKDVLLRILDSHAVDLIPLVEGGKQIGAAVVGKNLKGEELSIKSRVWHGVKGLANVALDVGTLGEGRILKEGGHILNAARRVSQGREARNLSLAGRELLSQSPELLRQAIQTLRDKGTETATHDADALEQAAAILEYSRKHQSEKK